MGLSAGVGTGPQQECPGQLCLKTRAEDQPKGFQGGLLRMGQGGSIHRTNAPCILSGEGGDPSPLQNEGVTAPSPGQSEWTSGDLPAQKEWDKTNSVLFHHSSTVALGLRMCPLPLVPLCAASTALSEAWGGGRLVLITLVLLNKGFVLKKVAWRGYVPMGMPCTQCARSAKFWMSANTRALVSAPFHKFLVPYQDFF